MSNEQKAMQDQAKVQGWPTHSEKGLRELVARLLEEACYIYEVDNGIVIRYVCQFCQLEPAKRESVNHRNDCPYHAAEQALAATPAVREPESTRLTPECYELLACVQGYLAWKHDKYPLIRDTDGSRKQLQLVEQAVAALLSSSSAGPSITEAQAQDAYCDSFDTDAPAVAPAPDFKRLAKAINRFLAAPSSAGPAVLWCPKYGGTYDAEVNSCGIPCPDCGAAQPACGMAEQVWARTFPKVVPSSAGEATPATQTNWKGVRWCDSVRAGMLAEEIALHFAHDCHDSMCGEDADESNCEMAWVESKIDDFLYAIGAVVPAPAATEKGAPRPEGCICSEAYGVGPEMCGRHGATEKGEGKV